MVKEGYIMDKHYLLVKAFLDFQDATEKLDEIAFSWERVDNAKIEFKDDSLLEVAFKGVTFKYEIQESCNTFYVFQVVE